MVDEMDKKADNTWMKYVECTNWPKDLKTPEQIFNEGVAWGQKQVIDQQVEVELRDQFAMAALTGLVTRKIICDEDMNIADLCYGLADQMLKVRKK